MLIDPVVLVAVSSFELLPLDNSSVSVSQKENSYLVVGYLGCCGFLGSLSSLLFEWVSRGFLRIHLGFLLRLLSNSWLEVESFSCVGGTLGWVLVGVFGIDTVLSYSNHLA